MFRVKETGGGLQVMAQSQADQRLPTAQFTTITASLKRSSIGVSEKVLSLKALSLKSS